MRRSIALAVSVAAAVLVAGCATGGQIEATGLPEPEVALAPSAAPVSSAPRREYPDDMRIVPNKDELPVFEATEVLEAEAATVPVPERRFFGVDEDGIMGFTAPLHRRGGNAFPVFHFDGSLRGIFVANVGIISRAEYEDPSFDPEQAAMDRMGEDEYWSSMERLYCAGLFLERTGQPPEKAEDVVC